LTISQFALAGFFVGIGIATKHFALLYVPLGLAIMYFDPAAESFKSNSKKYLKTLGIVLMALIILSLLSNPSLGFIKEQFKNQSQLITGIKLSFLIRIQKWIEVCKWIMFSQTANVLCTILVPLSLVGTATRWKLFKKEDWIKLTLAGFVLAYFILLCAVNFEIYNRYALVAAPFIIVLFAVAFQEALSWVAGRLAVVPVMEKIILLSLVALFVMAGFLNVRNLNDAQLPGAFSGNDGIDQVAWYVKNHMAKRPVIFTSTIGWDYDFYLYGYPVAKRVWINSPNEIRDVVAEFPSAPYYMVWRKDRDKKYEDILRQLNISYKGVFSAYSGQGEVEYTIVKLTL
jgi:hypothetical protein